MSDAKIKVLIVDDDAEQRESLVEWFTREGLEATATDSGENALALLKKDPTIYEVLLTDQMLKVGMDGLMLLNKVKAEYPSLEVVLFSGKDPNVDLEALRAGAYRYITKPYSLEELIFVVQQAAEHRRLKQEAVLSKLAGVVEAMTGKIADGPKIILQQAVESAVALIGADCGVLYLYDTTKQEFYFDRHNVISTGLQGELFLKDKPRATGMAQHIRKERVFPVNDISQDLPEDFRGHFLEREGIKSFVGVAVRTAEEEMAGGEVGVLYLNFRKAHRFTKDERSVIEVFANLVASVIRSAWLLERTRTMAEQQTTLREIASTMSTELDPQTVAGKILDELQKVIAYRMASMQRIRGDIRTQLAGHGFDPGPIPDWALKPISLDPLIKPIVERKETLILSDLSQIPEGIHWKRHAETEHIQSWVCIPLIYGNEVIGLLTLDHDQPGYYQQMHKEILDLYALQAAIAIRNAELVTDLQRQIAGREMLNRVGIELSGSFNEEVILQSVARATAETIPSTHCTVFCVENKELVTRASYGNRGWSFPLGRIFLIGAGVAGWVAENNQSALIPDSRVDSRFQSGWSGPQADPLSLLDVPVVVAEEIYGVISVEHDQSYAFDEHDQQLLELLALQVGQAVQNARLFRQEQRRSEVLANLQQVAKAISGTLDLQHSLECIVQSAVELTKSDAGIIYVIDATQIWIETSYEYPKTIEHPLPRFSEKKGLTWDIFNSRKPVEILNVPHDPRVSPEFAQSGVQVMLGLPLITQDQVNGVLFLNVRESHEFTQEEKNVLTILTEQGAVAIQNAQLYHMAQKRATRLAKLQEVATLILAEPAQLKSVANEIVNSLREIFADVSCAVRLYDPITEEFRDLVSSRDLAINTYYPPRKDGISAYVVETLQSVYIENVTAPPIAGIPSVRPERIAEGVRAAAYLPLISEGCLIGRLSMYWKTAHHFPDDDKLILKLFANQASIAIKNAQLFQQLKDQKVAQINAIGEISAAVSNLEQRNVILDKLLDSTLALMGKASLGEIRLIEGDTLVSVTSRGATIGEEHRYIPLGQGITGWVAQHGESQLLPDVTQDSRYLPFLENTRSEIAVPMKSGEKIIGVLNIEHPQVDALNKDHLKLAEAMAGLAMVAITNAELYERTQTLGNLGSDLADLEVGI